MSVDWTAWTAEEPSSDFADRVAAAMVREVVRRKASKSTAIAAAPRRRRGHLVALLVAACMAGGAAWGFSRLAESRRSAPGRSPAIAVDSGRDIHRTSENFVPPTLPIEAAREPALPVVAAKPRTLPTRAVGSAAPLPIVPRCTCAHADGVCGCLE